MIGYEQPDTVILEIYTEKTMMVDKIVTGTVLGISSKLGKRDGEQGHLVQDNGREQ